MTIKGELEFGTKIDETEYIDRVGVYAIIYQNNKLAIIKSGDRYFLPGGGLEENESQEECLRRECKEEIGYEINIGNYIGMATQYLYSYKTQVPLRIIGHFYRVELEEYIQSQIEDDHELVWFSPEEAIKRMYVEFQAWAISKTI